MSEHQFELLMMTATILLSPIAAILEATLLKRLVRTAEAIKFNGTPRQALTATLKSTSRRIPVWDGFVSASFFVVLVVMFFDPSPVTRLTVAFEFLVITTAVSYGLVFTFRLALLRAERART
jgi:hypothetical protein